MTLEEMVREDIDEYLLKTYNFTLETCDSQARTLFIKEFWFTKGISDEERSNEIIH